MNPKLEQQLDSYIQEHMQRKLIPGLALAGIKDGSTLIEKSYGFANLEHNVPATSDTAYQIASMTKGFTAAASMLLAADGKLSLDESLDRFRPGLPDPCRAITVRHLITHTSGIAQWALDWDCEELTVEKIDQHAFGRPLHFLPGTQFEYVDTNYNILGMIIHQLTGAPYDAFLQERIFQPLGWTLRPFHGNTMVDLRMAGWPQDDDTYASVSYKLASFMVRLKFIWAIRGRLPRSYLKKKIHPLNRDAKDKEIYDHRRTSESDWHGGERSPERPNQF